jgi:hypothetical protein
MIPSSYQRERLRKETGFSAELVLPEIEGR